MESDPYHFIQIVFGLLFFGTLLAGGYLVANYQRIFGPDPDHPSENGSSRAYSKVQVTLVWMHAVAITGALAFLLH